MQELCQLFTENGIDMTIEQCAEMFSVVSDIKNEMLEDEKNGGSKAGSKIKDEKVNTAL